MRKETDSSKESNEIPEKPTTSKERTIDFATGMGLKKSPSDRSAHQQNLESSQEKRIETYKPGRWERSEVKKIYLDRLNAACTEVWKGHLERIPWRLQGHIPNEELSRLFKDTDLKRGTYIDLGAGAGNFITHALKKLIKDWDHADTKIYAIDKDQNAITSLNNLADAEGAGKVTIIGQDYTEKGSFEKIREENGISNAEGILWANNGHYYSPEQRVDLMRQMKSLLKPDGKLLIVEYDTFKQHQGKDKDGNDVCYNKYPLPKKQLKRELKEAGFENVQILRKLPSRDQYMMYSAIATPDSSKRD
jgi:SAM-dependent methyltransferase